MPNLGAPPADDRQLLHAWERITCGRAGFYDDQMEGEERIAVQQQKDSRGTLFEWLYEGLGDWCQSCLQSLYESGLRYQNVLMTAIRQFHDDFWTTVPSVAAMRSPAWCGTTSVTVCIGRLRARQPSNLEETIDLFRRQAQFIDSFNRQLDTIEDPRVKQYMTCRAVVGARIDYELTPEDRLHGRGEANRRSQDFFRIEATVGVD
jgi:hypothetical protein